MLFYSESIRIAYEEEYFDMFKYLLSVPNIDVKTGAKDILADVVSKGKIDVLKLLLSYPNIDVNTKYISWPNNNYIRIEYAWAKTILFIALEKNNLEIFKLLLSYQGIDVKQEYFYVSNFLFVFD